MNCQIFKPGSASLRYWMLLFNNIGHIYLNTVRVSLAGNHRITARGMGKIAEWTYASATDHMANMFSLTLSFLIKACTLFLGVPHEVCTGRWLDVHPVSARFSRYTKKLQCNPLSPQNVKNWSLCKSTFRPIWHTIRRIDPTTNLHLGPRHVYLL